MPEEKKNHLTRRDALKVLGAAAGATALANLPNKWNSPELLSGVLPAHAQTSATCTDWAVYIEVLSGEFVYSLIGGPAPDLVTGDGGPGSTVAWACQEGCLFLWFDLSFEASSGSVRFVTIAGETIENYDFNDTLRDVVVEMGTGAISILPGFEGGTAGSCVFPDQEIPLDQSQPDALQRSNSWQ